MDRALNQLENKLGLDDKDKSLMTIVMHTNTRNTVLLNVKQMKSFFIPRYELLLNGKHDYDNDINGINDFKDGILKYFSKNLYQHLITDDYNVVKKATNYLEQFVTKFHHNYAKKYHLPLRTFDNNMFYARKHHFTNQKQAKAVYNVFDNEPKSVQIALDVLSAEDGDLGMTYGYLASVKFLTYFRKHPNVEFTPNKNTTMADPFGVPDGFTPKECEKSTLKYFKDLNKQLPMTPFEILHYCKKHIENLNNQIKAVAKRHPRIHYKKYLRDNKYNLNYFNDDFTLDGFNFTGQTDLHGVSLVKNNQDYHWVLHHLGAVKLQYLRLKTLQEQYLSRNNYTCSFASDVMAHNFDYEDKGVHQLSNNDIVNDYFKYTKNGKSLKSLYKKLIRIEKLKQEKADAIAHLKNINAEIKRDNEKHSISKKDFEKIKYMVNHEPRI